MSRFVIGCTGHRPAKLGGNSAAAHNRLLRVAIAYLGIQPDVDRLAGISGMALGWDQAFAGACLHVGIPFVAAVPYDGQEARWSGVQKTHYAMLLSKAHKVVVCSPGPYAAWKMHVRNERIVDRCNRLVALWNGEADGGTAACLMYAAKVGRETVNLWDVWKEAAQ